MFEKCTKMQINERHPYVGDLVFTAFSGSHQDAINKGVQYMKETGGEMWEIPYLPINPADVGRQYEPIIRINSQSGKGGAAFVMQNTFGYTLPKKMHPEFGALVKAECDRIGRELSTEELFNVFRVNYLEITRKYKLVGHNMIEESGRDSDEVHFHGTIECNGAEHNIHGIGNGPVDAFFQAIKQVGLYDYEFISYHEHAISSGSDSKAIAYIELKKPDGKTVFAIVASMKGNLTGRSASYVPRAIISLLTHCVIKRRGPGTRRARCRIRTPRD
jgi:2-isopropylmalate synthase